MTRQADFCRETRETSVRGSLRIDGIGQARLNSGIGFLNHMLDLWVFHSGFDLELECHGDTEVCAHHSIEDIALTIGGAFQEALADRQGIARYATVYLPMDEVLSRTVVDISGRPYHRFGCAFNSDRVGDFPTEMTGHFFHSFAVAAGMTLHQEVLYGDNDHHRIESLFKGFARALAQATLRISDKIPSSKGVL
jgi:imidazoleglycerol phosphate dehydratase HisB